MTPKQTRFITEYLVDLNATHAAIRAGYSPSTARQQGYENLTKPYMTAAIAAAQADRSQQTGITAARVLRELARIAFADPRPLFDGKALTHPTVWDEETRAAVASFKVSDVWQVNADGEREVIGQLKDVKFWSKLVALDLLGKHLGLWTAHQQEGSTISELLKAVLLEVQHHHSLKSVAEADWAPLTPATPSSLPPLPPPPAPEEVPPVPKEVPQW